MSGRKEYIEYQLEKIHRAKLEQELGGIRNELSEYYSRREEISVKRRRENIYVLFALAIIGAFFTIIPRSSISIDTPFLIGFGVFVLASVLFLIIKINTVALSEYTASGENSGKIDNYSEYIFAFSINGSLLLVIAVAIVNVFNIQVSSLVSSGVSIVAGLLSVLTAMLSQILTEKRKKQRRRQRMKDKSEEIREELSEEMISGFQNLREAENRKEELEIFNELSSLIKQSRHEFANVEELAPVSKELDDLEGVSDEISDILRETFSETQEELEDEKPEDESLEEKKRQLQEEYERMISGNEQ
jgi:hypothetical protein